MESETKNLALKVLRHLLVGNYFHGLRFGWPHIFVYNNDPRLLRVKSEVYIMCESRFKVYDDIPVTYPTCEEDIEQISKDEELRLICSLRNDKINDVAIGDNAPHLIITFESGRVFFMNGHNDQYESWEVGTIDHDDDEDFLVVVVPGDDFAVWVPKSFNG
jgi:hypothetical protein